MTDLEGVGPKLAQIAARIGVRTLGDLLEHLPFDHRDYERQRLVSELAVGEEATVSVEVGSARAPDAPPPADDPRGARWPTSRGR